MESVNKIVKTLTEFGDQVPQIKDAAKKTGLESGYLLLAGIVVAALLLLITMGGTILTVIATVVYPGYKSIKALETKDTGDDDKEWLTYWCVFGIFSLIDEFAGIVLSLIPFYSYIKLGLFVWMMHPQLKGSSIIYAKLLRPLLLSNKDKIEKFINEVKG